jgi:hypothetical protein
VEESVRPGLLGLPTERPRDVHELMWRIQAVVAEVTRAPESLWLGGIGSMPAGSRGQVGASSEGVLLLGGDAAALVELTAAGQDGPLSPGTVLAAQRTVQEAIETLAELAVPPGHDLTGEAIAQGLSPEHNAVNRAVRTRFAQQDQNEILRRVLPAHLAAQLQTAEPSRPEVEFTPAARRFAVVIDNVKGNVTDPSEIIRRMAGQDHRGAGRAVGEAMVANSGIPVEYRPAAVQMIGETVVSGFKELADRDLWTECHNDAGEVAGKSRLHGRDLGNLVNGMMRVWENDPEFAQQDRAATERKAATMVYPDVLPDAAKDSHMRFAHDEAATPTGTAKAPVVAPSATRAGAAGDSRPRGIGGRG